MNRRFVVFGWAVLLCGTASVLAGEIDPSLQLIMNERGSQATISTFVFLSDSVNVSALNAQLDQQHASAQRRHEVVVRALQEKAAATQVNLAKDLDELLAAGRIETYEPFWVDNSIRVDAPASEILLLAARADVGVIYYNYEIETIRPVGDKQAPAAGQNQGGQRTPTPTAGLIAVRAPEVWAMGYDGTGVLTSTLDTGVDGNHPALHNRWRGLDPLYSGHPEWAWFDPVTNTTYPQSFGSHGTHTMGTTCGGPPGDQIGVAPGCQWIHAAVIDRVSIDQTVADAKLAFQWLIDPDGNPSTDWDVPQVNSNSWGLATYHGYQPCDQTFWSFIDADEAAGIVVIFSAGNEGPGAETVRRPADRATTELNAMAIGAVDSTNYSFPWPIAGFSSRGPSHCTPGGSAAIKPEVSAPGVDVYSSVPGGGYEQGGWSGTSMASPHVNGVIALVRQACPQLTVEQVKQIILDSATDEGPAGNDNDYGYGVVDAVVAVNMALDQCIPHPPTAFGDRVTTTVNTGITITLTADDDGKPDPPGVLSYAIAALPAHGHLIDPGAGAILSVPYTLASLGNQVYYQPNAYYTGDDTFNFLANDGGVPPEGGDSNVASIVVTVEGVSQLAYSFPLDADPGWTAQGQWAFGQPMGGGSHNLDPTSGHTGANVYGYNLLGDYPNNMGQYFLTTPAINCSQIGGTQLRFYRWLGVEAYDHARIDVSTDGATWVNVWENNGITVNEGTWSSQAYNLASTADGHPTVYLRWGMGPSDHTVTFPGWNIDDIEIWGLVTPLWVTGDLNCDGVVDFADINPFILRLSNPASYWMTYPACSDNNGDINGDGAVDFGDINPFVSLLAG
jgi:subtilisin family serine protease